MILEYGMDEAMGRRWLDDGEWTNKEYGVRPKVGRQRHMFKIHIEVAKVIVILFSYESEALSSKNRSGSYKNVRNKISVNSENRQH